MINKKQQNKKKVDRLSERQVKTLEYLGLFLYLTPSQFFRLGLDKHRSNFQTQVTNYLKEKGYIGNIVPTEQGEYENIYYLTEAGAKELVRLTPDLKYESLKIPSKKDYTWGSTYYWHSKYEIDCYIECYLASQQQGIRIMDYDLEVERHSEGGREKKTTITIGNDRVDPDAIFKISTCKGDKLYAFEMERRDNRTLYQLDEKIRKHIQALNAKSISATYRHPKGHRILFVCEHEATRDYIIDYLKDHVENATNWFLFKTLDEVVPLKTPKGAVIFSDDPLYWKGDPDAVSKAQAEKKNFYENWTAINGQKVSMF